MENEQFNTLASNIDDDTQAKLEAMKTVAEHSVPQTNTAEEARKKAIENVQEGADGETMGPEVDADIQDNKDEGAQVKPTETVDLDEAEERVDSHQAADFLIERSSDTDEDKNKVDFDVDASSSSVTDESSADAESDKLDGGKKDEVKLSGGESDHQVGDEDPNSVPPSGEPVDYSAKDAMATEKRFEGRKEEGDDETWEEKTYGEGLDDMLKTKTVPPKEPGDLDLKGVATTAGVKQTLDQMDMTLEAAERKAVAQEETPVLKEEPSLSNGPESSPDGSDKEDGEKKQNKTTDGATTDSWDTFFDEGFGGAPSGKNKAEVKEGLDRVEVNAGLKHVRADALHREIKRQELEKNIQKVESGLISVEDKKEDKKDDGDESVSSPSSEAGDVKKIYEDLAEIDTKERETEQPDQNEANDAFGQLEQARPSRQESETGQSHASNADNIFSQLEQARPSQVVNESEAEEAKKIYEDLAEIETDPEEIAARELFESLNLPEPTAEDLKNVRVEVEGMTQVERERVGLGFVGNVARFREYSNRIFESALRKVNPNARSEALDSYVAIIHRRVLQFQKEKESILAHRQSGENPGWRKKITSTGFIAGSMGKVGRGAAELFGYSAFVPVKLMMLGAGGVKVGAEIVEEKSKRRLATEARGLNEASEQSSIATHKRMQERENELKAFGAGGDEILAEVERIHNELPQEVLDAYEEAYKMNEAAKVKGVEQEGVAPTMEAIKLVQAEALPEELKERLSQGAKQEGISGFARWVIERKLNKIITQVNAVETDEEKKKLIESWGDKLRHYEGVIGKCGLVDTYAWGGRGLAKGIEYTRLGLAAEAGIESIWRAYTHIVGELDKADSVAGGSSTTSRASVAVAADGVPKDVAMDKGALPEEAVASSTPASGAPEKPAQDGPVHDEIVLARDASDPIHAAIRGEVGAWPKEIEGHEFFKKIGEISPGNLNNGLTAVDQSLLKEGGGNAEAMRALRGGVREKLQGLLANMGAEAQTKFLEELRQTQGQVDWSGPVAQAIDDVLRSESSESQPALSSDTGEFPPKNIDTGGSARQIEFENTTSPEDKIDIKRENIADLSVENKPWDEALKSAGIDKSKISAEQAVEAGFNPQQMSSADNMTLKFWNDNPELFKDNAQAKDFFGNILSENPRVLRVQLDFLEKADISDVNIDEYSKVIRLADNMQQAGVLSEGPLENVYPFVESHYTMVQGLEDSPEHQSDILRLISAHGKDAGALRNLVGELPENHPIGALTAEFDPRTATLTITGHIAEANKNIKLFIENGKISVDGHNSAGNWPAVNFKQKAVALNEDSLREAVSHFTRTDNKGAIRFVKVPLGSGSVAQ